MAPSAIASTLILAASLACASLTSASPQIKTFSTGLSQGTIKPIEQSIFSYTLSPESTHGVITHWWITGGNTINDAIISMYIDGETTASITFTPSMAAGVGFDDVQGAWGTDFFGKGAASGAWFNNFRIPFQQSINITYKAGVGHQNDVIYMIVRGAENLPVNIGGVDIPVETGARMTLQVVQGTFAPLDYINVVDIPTGQGMVLSHTLSFSAGNLNTLEGCYHYYTPYDTAYPGMLLSTGTEDFFISAYYFNAGVFHLPNSGLTHISVNASTSTLSAYRMFYSDPLVFSDGAKLTWRNGDATDPATGLKCLIENGGNVVGSPTNATVNIYSWVYTW